MKIIVVNWRWFDKNNKAICQQEYDHDGNKIVISAIFETKEFNDHIQNILTQYTPSQCIVLTHFNPPNSFISISKEAVIIPINWEQKIKVYQFSGASGENDYIYFGTTNHDGLFSPSRNNDVIHVENFNKVWNYYWNELELNYQKKKLIDTFLPLAIDIQGLSEVSQDKKNSYFKRIKATLQKKGEEGKTLFELLTNFPDDDFSAGWNEIKDLIDSDYDKFSTKQLAEEISMNDFNAFSKSDFLKPDNSWFLPKWLQHVVSKFDEKIDLAKKQ